MSNFIAEINRRIQAERQKIADEAGISVEEVSRFAKLALRKARHQVDRQLRDKK